jgi:rare lipoprotein A
MILLLLACAAPIYQSGKASWYGAELAGNPTASGETFRPSHRTAAHPSLPFGTVVRVTRPDTGQQVRVVINDRGPYAKGRIIDLARRAARKIDMIEAGVVEVELQIIGCKKRYARRGIKNACSGEWVREFQTGR